MSGYGAKIWTGDEKSRVGRASKKTPEWRILSRLARLRAVGAGLLAVSVGKRVELAVPIGVSLTMWLQKRRLRSQVANLR